MVATDGNIGEVKEFYFDDETWAIRYLIVETGNWFSNKKVLIAPQTLFARELENENFPVNLTKEQIKSSPHLDTDQPASNPRKLKCLVTMPGNVMAVVAYMQGAPQR